MQALIDFFGVKDLIPHGYCLSWSPALLWTHVISDLLIMLAYYSIPLTLVYFIRQRKDVPYSRLVTMFAGFIVACGTMHLLAIITIWIPLYWLDGLFKSFTAIISVAAALLMIKVIPHALAMPSSAQLQDEIQQRKTAEEALCAANAALQQNSARTQLLVDSALDGIISMDHNGKIIGWNGQAEHIFGYSSEQALGQKLADLIVPPAYREQHRQGLARFMATGVSNIIGMRLEITGMRADTSEFPLELAVDAVGHKDDYFFSAYVRDISERKQAETAQREALDKLQKIAAQLPGVVFQFRLRADGSYCLPYASEVLRDLYRVDPEDVRDDAAKVFAAVHPDDLAQHWASIQTSAHGLSPWRNEYRLKFDDGTERWLFGNALPQQEEDGSVLWHGFVTDISERKMIEEAVRESENKLATILDNVDAFIYIKDCNYQYQYANQAARQLLNRPLEDIIGKLDDAFFDETTTAKLREHDRRVVELGERIAAENTYTQKGESSNSTYLSVKQPLRREDGSIYGLCGISTDISERKQMEEKLRDSEAFNASILNSLTSHIAVLDANGTIIAVNNAWRQFAEESGLSAPGRDMLGRSYLDACENACGEGASPTQAGIMAVLRGELETFHLEYPCRLGSKPRWFHMTVLPLQGSRRGVVVSHKNITERKAMEDELKNSEAKFRSIIEVSPVPLALSDEQLNITFLNPAFVQTFGYTLDDIPTVAEWWPKAYPDPDYRHWAESSWAAALEKTKREQISFPPMEVAIRCKDNSIKTVLVATSVIKHDAVNTGLVVMYDITQLKQIEAELTRSNADLEQFAYAVSHDMRQPLRMVSSYLSLIESALAGQLDDETQQFLNFAIDGAKRMDAMILSLLDYSRIGRKFEAKTWISSKASLDEALAFLNPELNTGGEIKVTGEWPELFASRDELTRLLQNLIGNALKYHEENQPPKVHVHGKVCGELLRVEVRDYGIGIEPSQLDRLFKVFSRLQARSRFEGSGVGLALCRRIVEHHDGAIGVESDGEGQGSLFWFELPIVNAENPG